MTLPFVHKDAHLANICVRDHHRLYNYTRGKIFELTWQAFGVYSVIDWNSSDVSCVRQNSISHFPIPLNKFTKDFERSYPGGEEGVSLLLQAVMNKTDKTLFTLRYLDDTESLTPPSFHSRQTTSNKFSSILEVAPCPISEASNSMEHELALLSRRLSRYGKQLKLGMKRPEDSHKEFHKLYDHFACLQSTEFFGRSLRHWPRCIAI